MKLFVTADWHMNHKNTIEYCNRPFKDVKHMNDTIIYNANQRCKEDDFLWHLGDLLLAKSSQAEFLLSFKNILNLVNARMYFIRGNHDQNNGGKNLMLYSVLLFANTKFLFTHVPPGSPAFKDKYYIDDIVFNTIDCILCGHIHDAWKVNYHTTFINKKIPIINVGVDVRKYYPISMDEVNVLYQRLRKELK